MSLINRLLQDLDSRQAGQSEDLALPPDAHAIVVPVRRNGWKVAAMWLLLLLACAIFAATYFWKTDSRFKSKVEGLRTFVGTTAQAPVTEMPQPIPQTVRARVEAALMVPVFQLSNELALSPARAQRTSSSDMTETASGKTKDMEVRRRPSDGAGSKPGSVARRDSKTDGGETTVVSAPPRKIEQKKLAAPLTQTQPSTTAKKESTDQEKSTVVSSAATKPVREKKSEAMVEEDVSGRDDPAVDIRSIEGQSDEPEEVVILADLTSSPIERQARALTTYERAENAFLKGVEHIRQGRMNDAETSFRSAIVEDRSHASARQALVGILIEAGRNDDAEAVLAEALSFNPRQPNQAMILARLQVERGDLPTAALTLERARDYATSDAGFISFHAAVLQRAARHREAAMKYRNALALVQGNAIWSMGLGISLRAVEDTAGAKDAFRTAATAGTLSKDLQAFVEQQLLQLNRGVK